MVDLAKNATPKQDDKVPTFLIALLLGAVLLISILCLSIYNMDPAEKAKMEAKSKAEEIQRNLLIEADEEKKRLEEEREKQAALLKEKNELQVKIEVLKALPTICDSNGGFKEIIFGGTNGVSIVCKNTLQTNADVMHSQFEKQLNAVPSQVNPLQN